MSRRPELFLFSVPSVEGRWAAAIIWGFVAAVGLLAMQSSESITTGITSSAIILTVGGVCATRIILTRQNSDIFGGVRLGPMFTISFILVFGLTTFVWLWPVTGSPALIPLTAFPRAALIASLGLAMFVIGYKMFPAGVLRPLLTGLQRLAGQRKPVSTSAAAPLTLWGLAMISVLVRLMSGNFEYLSSGETATSSLPMLYSLIGSLGIAGSYLATWNWTRDGGKGRLVLAIFIVGSQCIVGLYSGMKENIVVHFLAALLAYFAWRRFSVAPLIVVALLWVTVLSPAVAAYRQLVQVGGDRVTGIAVFGSVSISDIASGVAETGDEDGGARATVLRLSRLGDVAMISDTVPDRIQYKDTGELLVAPAMGLIPRSVWPDKPVLDTGYQMGMTMYDLPDTVRTSFAVTPYGDLWWHGGWLVVGVGMAALGAMVSFVDRTVRRLGDPRPQFLAVFLLPIVVKQESEFMSLLMLGPSTLLAYVVSSWLATRRRTVETASPNA